MYQKVLIPYLLDLKMNSDKSKGTFKFNQKMKLDDLKDTKLEKAISTIQSQGSLKSSGLFGGTLPKVQVSR